MSEGTDKADRLLRIVDVKSLVGLGKSKIYALVAEGAFPKPYKLSPKAARWGEREIVAWIESVRLPGR